MRSYLDSLSTAITPDRQPDAEPDVLSTQTDRQEQEYALAIPWLRSPAEFVAVLPVPSPESFSAPAKARGSAGASGDAGDRGRLQWDEARDQFLLKYLVHATMQRKQTSTGWFPKEVWEDLRIQFNATFNDVITVEQLKYRRENIKRMHNVVHRLMARDDVFWDEDAMRFNTAEATWKKLIALDPRVNLLKNKRLHWLHTANELFNRGGEMVEVSPAGCQAGSDITSLEHLQGNRSQPSHTSYCLPPEGGPGRVADIDGPLHLPAQPYSMGNVPEDCRNSPQELHIGNICRTDGEGGDGNLLMAKLECPRKRVLPLDLQSENGSVKRFSKKPSQVKQELDFAGDGLEKSKQDPQEEPLSRALVLLQGESDLRDEEKLKCVDLFLAEEKLATAYCALKGSLRVMWLRQRLEGK